MKKELKDYLHFYIGCKIRANTMGIIHDWTDYNKKTVGLFTDGSFSLLLRPLSDMTIEEGAHVMKAIYHSHITYPLTHYKINCNEFGSIEVSIENDWHMQRIII